MPSDALLDTMSYSMRAYRDNEPALAFFQRTIAAAVGAPIA